MPGGPLVKVLLALAETVVQGGSVRDPLEYYKELANQTTSWVPLADQESLAIFQIRSPGVKKLTLAIALCPEGARSDQGETVHLVLLFSIPPGAGPSYLALLAVAVRLLESRAQREFLLGSSSATEAWSRLSQMESTRAAATRP
jgi:mannitol/fructose-specific phosphotransferase system IIA component (Ntr-type)